jgi:hypothetical protein
MTTLHLRNSISSSLLRLGLPRVQPIWIIRGFVLIAIALGGLASSPQARAVCQEGCDLSTGNTFLGDDVLVNTQGTENTGIGGSALFNNSSGSSNTATGYYALFNNTTGYGNTAIGTLALFGNTTGGGNTATGNAALDTNTTGFDNTANGTGALGRNTSGFQNTASGYLALSYNTTGSRNMANGYSALFNNRTGIGNTAIGFRALYQSTGSNNVGLGFHAGNNLTTGSGNLCIGSGVLGVAGESNTTRIRNVYSSVASARAVYINSDNKIGTLVSSRRFKEEIKSMDKASEAVLGLKPVTFHYKKEIEPNGAIMFGLIAEDVEKVDPDLVTRNDKGEPETVRYEAVNAMLLNEFLKEHRKVEEQGRRMEEQDRTIAQQETEIRALASKLQKVSAEIEVNRQARQMISSNE